MDIAQWRDRIDLLDELLLELLNRRAQCVLELGKIKKEKGQLVYSPARETTILDRIQGLNRGPLSRESIRAVFERIIAECRELQERQV
ncbi:MAG: chorismate mutase [Candidatus Latescibacteria bacterium]|nr:chorismate mutase [Candidatus Latescibacterota bacterium]